MRLENRDLIETVRLGGTEADRALAQLVKRGAAIIPDVVHAIESVTNWLELGELGEILPHIHTPEAVPALLEVAGKPGTLGMSALKALGRSKDKQALSGLLTLLQDDSLSEFRQRNVVAALGNLGYADAVPDLNRFMQEMVKGAATDPQDIKRFIDAAQEQKTIDEETLRLAIEVALASAKLGHHHYYPLVAALTNYHSENASMGDDEVVRLEAVDALQIVVGPGMIDVLASVLKNGRSSEICENALWALFYLGAKEVVPILIDQATNGKKPLIISEALYLLKEMVGDSSFDTAQAAQTWWQDKQTEFQSGICYRFGQPINLTTLVHRLESSQNRVLLGRELNIITGVDFGFGEIIMWQDPNDLIKNVNRWLPEEGKQYTAGQLYKYGFARDLGLTIK